MLYPTAPMLPVGITLFDGTWKHALFLTSEKARSQWMDTRFISVFPVSKVGKYSGPVIAGRPSTRPCVRHVALNTYLCMEGAMPTEKEPSKHLGLEVCTA